MWLESSSASKLIQNLLPGRGRDLTSKKELFFLINYHYWHSLNCWQIKLSNRKPTNDEPCEKTIRGTMNNYTNIPVKTHSWPRTLTPCTKERADPCRTFTFLQADLHNVMRAGKLIVHSDWLFMGRVAVVCKRIIAMDERMMQTNRNTILAQPSGSFFPLLSINSFSLWRVVVAAKYVVTVDRGHVAGSLKTTNKHTHTHTSSKFSPCQT